MRGHRADCIKYPTWNIYERVTRIGWKNVDVSILEEGFEGTPEELRWQERRYIEELNPTCNDNRPIVSKEDILEGSRQRSLSYYYRNKETLNPKRNKVRREKRAEKNMLSLNIRDESEGDA